ncbi:MAG: chemotaxis protein CheD [Pseudomonadota bacterium]
MAHVQNWPKGYKTSTVSVIQGEFQVSSDPGIVLSTVLGSCISVCLYDRMVGVGGMNHYLLAESAKTDTYSLKYGAHAMELLVNALLKAGASRRDLEAKVFGGSLMSGRFDYIGPRNAEFALNYLADEKLAVVANDTGGAAARRVNFHPATGQARVIRTQAQVTTEAQNVTPRPANSANSDRAVLF